MMSDLSVEYLAQMCMGDNLLKKTNGLSASYTVDINNYTFSSNYEEQDVDFKNSLLPLLQDISSNNTIYNICAYLKGHYKEVYNKKLIQIIIHVVPYDSALLAGIVQLKETFLKTLFAVHNLDINHYTWQVVPLKFVPVSYIVVVSAKERLTTDKLLEYFKEQIINAHKKMLASNKKKMQTEKKHEEKMKEKEKTTK